MTHICVHVWSELFEEDVLTSIPRAKFILRLLYRYKVASFVPSHIIVLFNSSTPDNIHVYILLSTLILCKFVMKRKTIDSLTVFSPRSPGLMMTL